MAAFAAYQAFGATHGGNMTVVDKVPPEMLHMVSAHWHQFPPMNPLWHSILGFTIFIIGMISMIGNYVVISVFTSTKSLRTPSNLLVVNLAFSDFLMMFTMVRLLTNLKNKIAIMIIMMIFQFRDQLWLSTVIMKHGFSDHWPVNCMQQLAVFSAASQSGQ